MKTIKEIFESNPSLLEEKEVKELVAQFKLQFDVIKRRHFDYWDKVTSITTNSELFVIDGIPCKDVATRIHELSFENPSLP